MISIGSIYSMYPRLPGLSKMHSIKLIDAHFWLHTLGVVFYIVSIWIAAITQGLMCRATHSDGPLTYSFVESLVAPYPSYLARFFSGVLVLAGLVLMPVTILRPWPAT